MSAFASASECAGEGGLLLWCWPARIVCPRARTFVSRSSVGANECAGESGLLWWCWPASIVCVSVCLCRGGPVQVFA